MGLQLVHKINSFYSIDMQGNPGQSGGVGDPEAVAFASSRHWLYGSFFLWLSVRFFDWS